MKKVAVIDYGMGNIDSVVRAVEECAASAFIANEPEKLCAADYIILPGVGAFAQGMEQLLKRGFVGALNERVIDKKILFLGICLGMQLMADVGYEGGETKGLGWIRGKVKRLIPNETEKKLPHVGWNEVIFEHASPLFKDILTGKDFYFVHSYNLDCEDKNAVLARTSYCGDFASAVNSANIFGVQFHPEKSQRLGMKLISNFLSFC